MFRAAARLQVPNDVSIEAVQNILERIADEIMVDLTIEASDGI
jgi:glycine cleavage system regulatory protein